MGRNYEGTVKEGDVNFNFSNYVINMFALHS